VRARRHPVGCANFTGAIGGSGGPASGAVGTIDNVVMMSK